MLKKLLICTALVSNIANAGQTQHSHNKPFDHAPIGVMGDHTHNKGEFMLSYRYSDMFMDGMRSGKNSLTTAQVHANYMVAPTEMVMNMHMLGAMYGVTDKLTITAMLPYVEKEMEHQTRMGVNFTTQTSGIGDIKLGGLYSVTKNAIVGLGVSLPTGATDERDDTPMASNAKLPYPMQLGSGTYDISPSITLKFDHNDFTFGGQLNAVIRTGDNDENYRLGNQANATIWAGYTINDYIGVSARALAQTKGNINGTDADLNPNMVATADANNHGGETLDIGLGINGIYNDARIAGEVLIPVEQKLDGPQMENALKFTLGVQYAF